MTQIPTRTDQASSVHPELAQVGGSMITSTAAKALAVLRISTGFVFLWAFLDKTFGLNYATPSAKAWINGGSPTKGFLASVEVGPLQSFFHAIAGTWWANGLFMLGLLAIGIALIAGVAMRIAAISGVVMLAMMWLAEVPFAQFTSAGEPTGSPNPIADSHFTAEDATAVHAFFEDLSPRSVLPCGSSAASLTSTAPSAGPAKSTNIATS